MLGGSNEQCVKCAFVFIKSQQIPNLNHHLSRIYREHFMFCFLFIV